MFCVPTYLFNLHLTWNYCSHDLCGPLVVHGRHCPYSPGPLHTRLNMGTWSPEWLHAEHDLCQWIVSRTAIDYGRGRWCDCMSLKSNHNEVRILTMDRLTWTIICRSIRRFISTGLSMHLPPIFDFAFSRYWPEQAKRHALVRWSSRIDSMGHSTRSIVQI